MKRPTRRQNPICEDDYKAVLPSLQEGCDRIRTEIGMLLRAEDITLGAPLEARVKSWSSLCDKFDRAKEPATDLQEIKDLVGVRVILLYRPDIERTLEILRGEFRIELEEKKGMDTEADGFGYQSVHVILRQPAVHPSKPAPQDSHNGQRVEVQIRTLAQHIWAAASHDLQYKKERAVPKPLRRTIQRVSALLETIDLELERVLEEREDYVAEIETNIDQLNLDIDILRKLLCDRLPVEHRDPNERYAKILEVLRNSGVDDIGALTALLDRRKGDACAFDSQIISALKNPRANLGNARLADYNPERFDRGVYFNYEGLVRKMLEFDKNAARKSRGKEGN